MKATSIVTSPIMLEAEAQPSRQERTHAARVSTLAPVAGSIAHELKMLQSELLSRHVMVTASLARNLPIDWDWDLRSAGLSCRRGRVESGSPTMTRGVQRSVSGCPGTLSPGLKD